MKLGLHTQYDEVVMIDIDTNHKEIRQEITKLIFQLTYLSKNTQDYHGMKPSIGNFLISIQDTMKSTSKGEINQGIMQEIHTELQ